MPIILCDNCSTAFNKKQSNINASKTSKHYCSKPCSNRGQTRKEDKECFTCGKITSKSQADIKKNKTGQFFCCKQCQADTQNKSGDLSNNWKGGFWTYKKNAIKTYGSVCNRCKYDKVPDILQVHHIDHNHSNNELTNLEVLCPNCHAIEHWSKHNK